MLPLLFLLINDNKLTLKNLSICRNIFCPPVHWVISEGGFANYNPRRASTRGKHKTFFRKRQTFSVCLLNSVIDSVSFSSSKPLWWDILISVISSVPEKHRVNYVVEMWDADLCFGSWHDPGCSLLLALPFTSRTPSHKWRLILILLLSALPCQSRPPFCQISLISTFFHCC